MHFQFLIKIMAAAVNVNNVNKKDGGEMKGRPKQQ